MSSRVEQLRHLPLPETFAALRAQQTRERRKRRWLGRPLRIFDRERETA